MRRFSQTALMLALACAALSAAAKEITVSAAASLREAFQEINTAYGRAHPDTQIRLNTAASGVLLQQLVQGAPVDVLATADQETMDKAAEANVIAPASRRTFALNDLVLIQPKSASVRVNTLQDLSKPQVQRVAVGNPASVPAGRYTKAALEKPVSYAIAVTASSKDAAEATRYLDFIRSREGNRILQKYGFNPARR